MTHMTRTAAAAAAAVMAAALATAGCKPGVLDPARPAQAGAPVVLTERVAASVLVAVTSGGEADGPLLRVLAATARPREHLNVIGAGGGRQAPVTSAAPPPVTVRIPGPRPRPAAGHVLPGSRLSEGAPAVGGREGRRGAHRGVPYGPGHRRLGPPPAGPRRRRWRRPGQPSGREPGCGVRAGDQRAVRPGRPGRGQVLGPRPGPRSQEPDRPAARRRPRRRRRARARADRAGRRRRVRGTAGSDRGRGGPRRLSWDPRPPRPRWTRSSAPAWAWRSVTETVSGPGVVRRQQRDPAAGRRACAGAAGRPAGTAGRHRGGQRLRVRAGQAPGPISSFPKTGPRPWPGTWRPGGERHHAVRRRSRGQQPRGHRLVWRQSARGGGDRGAGRRVARRPRGQPSWPAAASAPRGTGAPGALPSRGAQPRARGQGRAIRVASSFPAEAAAVPRQPGQAGPLVAGQLRGQAAGPGLRAQSCVCPAQCPARPPEPGALHRPPLITDNLHPDRTGPSQAPARRAQAAWLVPAAPRPVARRADPEHRGRQDSPGVSVDQPGRQAARASGAASGRTEASTVISGAPPLAGPDAEVGFGPQAWLEPSPGTSPRSSHQPGAPPRPCSGHRPGGPPAQAEDLGRNRQARPVRHSARAAIETAFRPQPRPPGQVHRLRGPHRGTPAPGWSCGPRPAGQAGTGPRPSPGAAAGP